MGDREFIETCGLNSYFRDLCKDQNDLLYKRRLQVYYSHVFDEHVLAFDFYANNLTWKQYYAKTIKAIADLKEKYDFTYTKGNPFFLLSYIDEYKNPDKILSSYHILREDEKLLILYALKKGAKIRKYLLLQALPDLNALKFLIENGGNYNLLRGEDLSTASKESMEYLQSLGL